MIVRFPFSEFANNRVVLIYTNNMPLLNILTISYLHKYKIKTITISRNYMFYGTKYGNMAK